MGKARNKKSRNADARKNGGPMAGRKPSLASPEIDAIRTSRILPVTKNLAASAPADRAMAAAAVPELAKDDTCRRLLLRERVVQKALEDLIHDPAEEVQVGAWGILRAIAEREGHDQCLYMYRRDVLKWAATSITKLRTTIAEGPENLPPATREALWRYSEDIIGLLRCLSQTNDQILDAITKIETVLPFSMLLLQSGSHAPEFVQATVAQFLYAMTDDNDPLAAKLIEDDGYVALLQNVKQPSGSALGNLIAISICGGLHNLALGPTQVERETDIDHDILPIITTFTKECTAALSNYSVEAATPEDAAQIRALEIALEVLASIATAKGVEIEIAQDNKKGTRRRRSVSPEIDDDNDTEMKLDGESEPAEQPTANGADEKFNINDLDDLMQQDMDAVTAGDHDSDGPDSSETNYLIQDTLPILSSLSSSPPPQLLELRLRALSALNNLIWTLNAAVPKAGPLHTRYNKALHIIWSTVINPVLTANTADIELASSVTGVAWAITAGSNGRVDVSTNQHHAFIALYKAATSDDLRTKCVGVLGALAFPQDRIETNREIGIWLVSLICDKNTPAEPLTEALNAVMDVYADSAYTYDEPVFVENGFVGHLAAAYPGVRVTARKVDRRKYPELRKRADEAANNLLRFIQYKKAERERDGK